MASNLLTRLFRRSDDIARGMTVADYIRQVTAQYGTYMPPIATMGPTGLPTERPPQDFEGLVTQAFAANPIVYGLVTKRGLIYSEARFMWQDIADGRPGDLSWDDGLALLEKPWPNGSTGEMLMRVDQDISLAGNAYIVRDGDRLRRLRPDWVQIVLSGDPREEHDIDVVGYVYGAGSPDSGNFKAYLPDEVAHVSPVPDPLASYRGMSWLTPVIREVQADKQATEHKLSFLKSGAVLGPVVKAPPGISVEQFKRFIEAAESAHSGPSNSGKWVFLANGADVQTVSANLKDIDLKALTASAETRMTVAALMPAVIAGVSEGLQGSSLNAGNYQAAKRAFADGTLRPLWRITCAELETILGVPEGKRLWFDETGVAFLREDQQDVAGIQAQQATTINTLVTAGFKPDSIVVAVRENDWSKLEHSGLTSVQLTPPGMGTPGAPAADADGDGVPDAEAPDAAGEDAYQQALAELRAGAGAQGDEETQRSSAAALAAFRGEDVERADRYSIRTPAGMRSGKSRGGQFRSLSAAVIGALEAWINGEGDDDPLEDFTPAQLRKAAGQLGVQTPQGASKPRLKLALLEKARADRRDQGREASQARQRMPEGYRVERLEDGRWSVQTEGGPEFAQADTIGQARGLAEADRDRRRSTRQRGPSRLPAGGPTPPARPTVEPMKIEGKTPTPEEQAALKVFRATEEEHRARRRQQEAKRRLDRAGRRADEAARDIEPARAKAGATDRRLADAEADRAAAAERVRRLVAEGASTAAIAAARLDRADAAREADGAKHADNLARDALRLAESAERERARAARDAERAERALGEAVDSARAAREQAAALGVTDADISALAHRRVAEALAEGRFSERAAIALLTGGEPQGLDQDKAWVFTTGMVHAGYITELAWTGDRERLEAYLRRQNTDTLHAAAPFFGLSLPSDGGHEAAVAAFAERAMQLEAPRRELPSGEELRQNLMSRKVPDLKVALRNAGLPVSGRKADLVDRLVAAYSAARGGGDDATGGADRTGLPSGGDGRGRGPRAARPQSADREPDAGATRPAAGAVGGGGDGAGGVGEAVSPADLRPGDYVHAEGVDQFGQAISGTGYLAGVPSLAQVGAADEWDRAAAAVTPRGRPHPGLAARLRRARDAYLSGDPERAARELRHLSADDYRGMSDEGLASLRALAGPGSGRRDYALSLTETRDGGDGWRMQVFVPVGATVERLPLPAAAPAKKATPPAKKATPRKATGRVTVSADWLPGSPRPLSELSPDQAGRAAREGLLDKAAAAAHIRAQADEAEAAAERLRRPDTGPPDRPTGRQRSVPFTERDRQDSAARSEIEAARLRRLADRIEGAAPAALPRKATAAPAKKAAAPAAEPDLTGASGLSQDPAVREVQVENRIRQAAATMPRTHFTGGVPMADLRESMPDVSREEFDAAVRRIGHDRAFAVIPTSIRKFRTERDRANFVLIGEDETDSIRPTGDGIPPLRPLPAAAPAKATPAKRTPSLPAREGRVSVSDSRDWTPAQHVAHAEQARRNGDNAEARLHRGLEDTKNRQLAESGQGVQHLRSLTDRDDARRFLRSLTRAQLDDLAGRLGVGTEGGRDAVIARILAELFGG